MEGKEFKFDYQRLIEENNVDVSELPDPLAEMIHLVDSHLRRALEKCTDGHCKLVIARLQRHADFILDELLSHFEERILNNELMDDPEQGEEKEEVVVKPTNEEITAKLQSEGRSWVTLDELIHAGFTGPMSGRYLKAGAFVLVKERFEDRWHIMVAGELNSKA